MNIEGGAVYVWSMVSWQALSQAVWWIDAPQVTRMGAVLAPQTKKRRHGRILAAGGD